MEDNVTFRVRAGGKPNYPVSGVRVGRFAVRVKVYGGQFFDRLQRTYIVNHINTGFSMADFDTFEAAMGFADDASRFARKDVSARTKEKLHEQLGEPMVAWMKEARRTGQFIPYRQWLAERQAA